MPSFSSSACVVCSAARSTPNDPKGAGLALPFFPPPQGKLVGWGAQLSPSGLRLL